MTTNKKINIALSGWSGAGTSTTTLMLAVLLKRRYIPLTSVFREVGKELGKLDKNHEDRDLPAFEEYIQPMIGKTVDRYVDYKLINDSGIILESDICAFRIGKRSEVFSVFLKADVRTRGERFEMDGRKGEGAEILRERDTVLREEYMKLWKVDIFDDKTIEEKYNLVMDSSKMSIREVLMAIVEGLKQVSDLKKKINFDKFEEEVNEVSKRSKVQLREDLERKELIMTTEEIMGEMVELFTDEIEQYPEEVKRIFRSS